MKRDTPRNRKLRYLFRQKKYNRIHSVKIAKYQAGYQIRNATALNNYALRRYKKIRTNVLNHYSDEDDIICACKPNGCTETRLSKMVIEHTKGKKLHNHQDMSNPSYYLKISEMRPKGLKVMCQRCNASKRNGNICRIHGTRF